MLLMLEIQRLRKKTSFHDVVHKLARTPKYVPHRTNNHNLFDAVNPARQHFLEATQRFLLMPLHSNHSYPSRREGSKNNMTSTCLPKLVPAGDRLCNSTFGARGPKVPRFGILQLLLLLYMMVIFGIRYCRNVLLQHKFRSSASAAFSYKQLQSHLLNFE